MMSRWWCPGPDDDSLVETDARACGKSVVDEKWMLCVALVAQVGGVLETAPLSPRRQIACLCGDLLRM